ncbi:MAG: Gfo/Idh/MocA family oxidoreductase [Sphaerobacter sp.]|nr:Gfo/Idh/MocA family oxidoreductase [Sphaerobacter sp.]
MRRLRVAVIGLGAFGESHVATLRSLEHGELVAVVSRRRERAEAIAQRSAGGAAYDDCRRMLAEVRVAWPAATGGTEG